jgi:hypothetical protein
MLVAVNDRNSSGVLWLESVSRVHR